MLMGTDVSPIFKVHPACTVTFESSRPTIKPWHVRTSNRASIGLPSSSTITYYRICSTTWLTTSHNKPITSLSSRFLVPFHVNRIITHRTMSGSAFHITTFSKLLTCLFIILFRCCPLPAMRSPKAKRGMSLRRSGTAPCKVGSQIRVTST
jgi:hypothetical protein